MAGYDATKPEGTDTIAASDDLIRSNFVQIYANFGNEHVNSAATATDCIHSRACGFVEKNMTDATAATTAITVWATGKTPKLITFDVTYLGGNIAHIHSQGYYDGTNHKCIAVYYGGAVVGDLLYTTVKATHCIAIHDNGAGVFQHATCAFTANTATLTWTKGSTPTDTAYIMWTAFG